MIQVIAIFLTFKNRYRAGKTMKRIAIIGAGLAGLTCGKALQQAGHDVVIFEKSRGIGGRLATRRAEPFYFDHGVAAFTASDDDFQSFVNQLLTEVTHR